MLNYREEKDFSKKYKTEYLDGIEVFIKKREREAALVREERNIIAEQDKYREEFCHMLGYPLYEKRTDKPEVEMVELTEENGYIVYRMRVNVIDDIMLTGVFYKAVSDEKKPLVLVQHGRLGTPEHIAGFYDGDTSNYNDMLERVLKQGVHVFAAQLLLWKTEEYGVEFDRKEIDARLKRVGSSITALEVYALRRVLDYFEGKPYVKNFGMVGLSYGGFYTLFTTAIDTRIKTAVSCSFFNQRDNIPWSDWVWLESAYKFDDADIACLVYPRKLCIEVGTRDEIFDCKSAEEAFETLKRKCKGYGTEWVDFVTFDGVHEFCRDDKPIEKLAKILFED